MVVGEKLKRKRAMAAELPEEVVHREILTRVPIKSAVRFKCVSKSWLSLISHPQFSKEHLIRNTSRNPNDYDCLVAKKNTNIVILSRYKETVALSFCHFGLVGSVRGLVCLRHDKKLSLWNPAIHQSKEFTLPPSRYLDHIEYMGFGFDPVGNNYKVVVLSSDLTSASIYYSDSDSWIDVFVPDNVYLLQNKKTFLTSSMTIVKDCPYWKFTTFARDTHNMGLITGATSVTPVKFDAGSNEFKLLPKFHFDTSLGEESYAFRSQFVDMNDCLTLIVHNRESAIYMLDIYSLYGEEGSCVWSKRFTIGPLDFHQPHWFVSQGFYGGEIVFDDQRMFSCFDWKTGTISRLSTTVTNITSVNCFRYTPSLVFLEGMKSVYLTTQTRGTTGLCSKVPWRLINSLRN